MECTTSATLSLSPHPLGAHRRHWHCADPDFIVRDDITAGAVAPILTDFEWEPFGIFIVRAADRRLPRR